MARLGSEPNGASPPAGTGGAPGGTPRGGRTARDFALPDLGEGLTEAEIVRWLVAVGDTVAVDQPVVEVETAKAVVEVPCPYGGVVTERHGAEGATVSVGTPLVTVAAEAPRTSPPATTDAHHPATDGARADGEPADGTHASGHATDGTPAAGGAGSGNVLVGYGTAAPGTPRVHRRRRVRHHPLLGTGHTALDDSVPSPVATPRTANAPEPTGPIPVISPLVRRLAREHRLDLRAIEGSGPQGLILRRDVERAARAAADGPDQPTATAPPPPTPAAATPAVATAATATAADDQGTRVPLRGIRGATAEKLTRSRQEIPDATCWVDADATELLAARQAMNQVADRPRVSLLAVLARVCTAALARYPELNATVDTASREIVRLPAVHLGFAAQTDRGLVVPVVRDAHAKDAETLSAELARLTEAARTGSLTPGDLTGGTFTLNNYGVFGVDGSTPIINHPEAAMLGVGRIVAKPWVHDGQLAVRQVVQLSLTFDHRVCDGRTAGGFLRYVADCVERPAVLLRTL